MNLQNPWQDTPTEDILERFGSDPRPYRPQNLTVKEGERFIEEPHSHFPIHGNGSCSAHQNCGELATYVHNTESTTLSFTCYSEEGGFDEEIHRIRVYKLHYHLTDDTFSLFEPHVENSGFLQGRQLKHQKVPSDDAMRSPYLHWKDLNVGIDISIFGKKYRITDCDRFTAAFLEERGIKLNPPEEIPDDPYMIDRLGKRRVEPKTVENELMEHSFYPRPSRLYFRCAWLDRDYSCQIRRTFRMTVFTADHTVALIDETPGFEGQLFLRRIRVPKPLEQDGIRRFYRYCDFRPGVWVDIFSRQMFIYECVDDETVRYMRQQFGETDYRACCGQVLKEGPPPMAFESLPGELRFLSRMIDPPPVLAGNDFILIYNVNTRLVDINEAGKQRKWSSGRCFLKKVDASTFSESQFTVGQIVQFFKWRFQLVEAERETHEYLRWRGRL